MITKLRIKYHTYHATRLMRLLVAIDAQARFDENSVDASTLWLIQEATKRLEHHLGQATRLTLDLWAAAKRSR